MFYQIDGRIVPRDYPQLSWWSELRPGGCYPSQPSQLWTPATLSPSEDYLDYTLDMAWPDSPDDDDRLYAEADNGGRLTMGRTTKTDYLNSLGWLSRLCPPGHTIMQRYGTTYGGAAPLLRDFTEYGLYDTCDDVTLTIVRFPQIFYESAFDRSNLNPYFQTLDFSLRSGNSGVTINTLPFLALELLQSPFVDDPPASSGLELTQTMRLTYFYGSGLSCSVQVDDVPIIESTSEWSTAETTIVLRLHGPATQPRKASASISNFWVTESLELEIGEDPLCNCEQGCCVRILQTLNGIDAGAGDHDGTPDNILSMELELA